MQPKFFDLQKEAVPQTITEDTIEWKQGIDEHGKTN
jgi:hypothetical protein